MDLIHGGDVTGFRQRFGVMPLDFSASLNPLGMPPAVREAARQAVDEATPYPDPLCRELRAAVAERFDVSRDRLVFGNGAADVIYRFVQALKPKTALAAAPTFAEYERALTFADCRIRRHRLRRRDGFRLGYDFVADINSDIDAVFLCQPNNPTGRLIERPLLSAILDRAEAMDAVVFLDECFCRFLEKPEAHSLVPELRQRKNLFILDSFTKLFAMAGIRLGFGMAGDSRLAARLEDAGQPWAVSSIAQAAGLAALGETEFVEESLRAIHAAKRPLIRGLEECGNTVYGSDANYIFFHSTVPALDERLMEKGILIRNCRNFHGLDDGYYRVAVRRPDENEQLLRAMRPLAGK